MLDPLTSLGLASNIVQLVSFGFEVLSKGHELATTGTTREQAHLEAITRQTKSICSDLQNVAARPSAHACRPPGKGQHGLTLRDEASVVDLGFNTKSVCDELQVMLEALSLDEAPDRRKRSIVHKAIKSVWNDKSVQVLRNRLSELQQQLLLKMGIMQR
jgi:hypothetical protein